MTTEGIVSIVQIGLTTNSTLEIIISSGDHHIIDLRTSKFNIFLNHTFYKLSLPI